MTPPAAAIRFVLCLAVAALAGPAALDAQQGAGDDRTLRWRVVAVEARLDGDGRLHVRERQAMVFSGDWNGGERTFDLRLGQELRLESLVRVDAGTGARTPLAPGDLSEVDEYEWVDDEVLRWRSRAASDPPFRSREIVYDLSYTLWPVLVPTGGDGYELRHDFAFADRAGVIERFEVELSLEPSWAGPGTQRIREAADRLPPGRGYTVRVPLGYLGSGEPAAVPAGAPGWVRALVVGGTLLVPLVTLLAVRRRDRELDGIAPTVAPESIDSEWLRSHLFTYPPEVVGTAWDRSVGQSEVAALLARLVVEGKLRSRVEAGSEEPVLHLRRMAPLDEFAEHERDLLEGLFFDGGDETDTAAIRDHYENEGFDPAARVRTALMARLDALPGTGTVKRRRLPAVAVVLAGIALVLIPWGRGGGLSVDLFCLLLAAFPGLLSLAFAATLARRVTHRAGPGAGVVLPLLVASLLLALLASGLLEGEGGLLFYRPGARSLLGLLAVLTGIGLLAIAMARSRETPERLAFRRRLVSAREFFERELGRPRPRLEDGWFPYLLAFGLGPRVDRWFRAHGGRSTGPATGAVLASAGALGGPSGGTWTGGGPQFGGGSFGGGGAGRAWSVAAAGMASGVSPPGSSGGGGGGTATSGGGGGGGW